MEETLLGRLATGEVVFDLAEGSHFATHAKVQEGLHEAVREALSHVSGGGEFIATDVDLGRVVGLSSCVPTGEDDEIVFAQRPNRLGLTRFVKGRETEPTETVSVILLREEDRYRLLSAWFGELAPPEPWDEKATAESVTFWSAHALVWGIEVIAPETESTDT